MKKRPKVVKKGYINIYSKLSPQENRQIYYKTLYKKQHPDWDDTLVYLSEKLNKYLNKGSTLLDIGCGNGSYLVDENRSKIGKAIGIDVDRKSVEKNVSMDEIKITAGDTFPFKDNSFDFTVSLWLLEHLVAPKLHFSEVNRVLKKGGKYLFATPNTCYPPLYINKLLLC
jgi:ubiquinone/menaquinone biosynthesis C-methylase UbiE